MIKGSFRVPVPFDYVFPYGALCLDVSPVTDFDKRGQADDQARDKETGQRLWQVIALDMDPEAARFGRQQVKVKIAAPVQPVPPSPAMPGYPAAIEFTGLVLTPWVDDAKCKPGAGVHKCKSRMAFSVKADAMIPGQIGVAFSDAAA